MVRDCQKPCWKLEEDENFPYAHFSEGCLRAGIPEATPPSRSSLRNARNVLQEMLCNLKRTASFAILMITERGRGKDLHPREFRKRPQADEK